MVVHYRSHCGWDLFASPGSQVSPAHPRVQNFSTRARDPGFRVPGFTSFPGASPGSQTSQPGDATPGSLDTLPRVRARGPLFPGFTSPGSQVLSPASPGSFPQVRFNPPSFYPGPAGIVLFALAPNCAVRASVGATRSPSHPRKALSEPYAAM